MDNLPRERFGQVFIKNRSGSFDLLDSASFSNLTLRWYTPEGDLHPDFEKHVGKSFSFGFTIHNTNNDGITAPFEIRLKHALGLGKNRPPDMDYFAKVLQQEIDLAKEVGLLKDESGPVYDSLIKTEFGAGFLFVNPGEEVINSRLTLGQGFGVALDSIIDPGSVSTRKPKRYGQLRVLIDGILKSQMEGKPLPLKQFCSTLMGLEDDDDEADDDFGNEDMFRKLEMGEAALKGISVYRELLSAGYNEEELKDIWESFFKVVEADIFIKSREWQEALKNEKIASKLIPVQVFVNEHTSTVGPLANHIYKFQGISVKPEIRKMVAVQLLLNQIGEYTGKLNSLFSYEKEFTVEGFHANNEVIMLHKVGKMSLERALQKVIDDTNQCVDTAQVLAHIIPQLAAEEEGITKFVEDNLSFLATQLQWMVYTRRYHDIVRIDCYVEDE